MLHTSLSTFLLATLACAPHPVREGNDTAGVVDDAGDDRPGGMVSAPHPAGQVWRWLDHPEIEVLLIPNPTEIWTAGVYVRTPEGLLATWSTREWADQPGWVPLLLLWPDATRGEARAAEETLSLPVVGSGEHGCDPRAALALTLHEDLSLEVTIEGVPYLALPPEGEVAIDSGEPVALALLEGDVVAHGAQGLSVKGGVLAGLILTADRPLPWLQLQAHTDFVEVDMDHSCEDAAWQAEGAPTLRLWIPLAG